jgi:hypothetical protein
MAVVKWTGLVTAMKGKLRGSVLQFGAGGQVMRSNKQFNQHSNIRWNASKNNVATVTNAWKQLTTAQRNAWAAQTVNYPGKDRYGNTHYPSPYTLFMRLNNALNFHTATMLTTPLGPASITNISPISIALGAGPTLTLNINVVTSANERVLIAATTGLSNGRRPPKGLYSNISNVDMSATTSYDFTTDYINRFGQVPAFCQIYISVTILRIDTGQQSTAIITNVFT